MIEMKNLIQMQRRPASESGDWGVHFHWVSTRIWTKGWKVQWWEPVLIFDLLSNHFILLQTSTSVSPRTDVEQERNVSIHPEDIGMGSLIKLAILKLLFSCQVAGSLCSVGYQYNQDSGFCDGQLNPQLLHSHDFILRHRRVFSSECLRGSRMH